MRAFPKPENASLTLIQEEVCVLKRKSKNPHKVVEKLRLGVFLSRPSGFESTQPENNYGICFGSEPTDKFLATELRRWHLKP